MPQVPEVVRKVEVSSLSLDRNNFRFATDQPTEEMAFNYLFDHSDVMSVARSLIREGYRTNEVPLVIEEDGCFVVLEANRRVSALRALREPWLVPNHRVALEQLAKRYQTEVEDLPHEIYVTVYPDRASAAPVLAREHIGDDKRRWELDEQAKFVLAQMAGGADVMTLRQTLTGIKDVVRVIKIGRVRQALMSVSYTDPKLAKFAAGSDLKMSVFEYTYRDKLIRPLLGFEFDQEGGVTGYPTSPTQIAVLERILRGIQDGELSTRKVLNHKQGPGYRAFIDELRSLAAGSPASTERPAQERAEPFQSGGDPDDFERSPQSSVPPTGAATTGDRPPVGSAPVAPNNPDTKKTLALTLATGHLPVGLLKRFIELRSMDLTKHPASTAMLLRSVVESSAKYHYSQPGKTGVNGMLGDVAKALTRDYVSNRALARSIKLLGNSLAPKSRPGSVDWFNGVSHDPAVAVGAQEIRDAWQELEPLIRFLTQP